MTTPPRSPAAAAAARDAFDEADRELRLVRAAAAGVSSPHHSRRSGHGDSRPDDHPAVQEQAQPSVESRYLSAASQYYTGRPAAPGESPEDVVDRLPAHVRDAIIAVRSDRDGASETTRLPVLDDQATERELQYLTRLREELAAMEPAVFHSRESFTLDAQTTPSR